jgi:hypothetical protein
MAPTTTVPTSMQAHQPAPAVTQEIASEDYGPITDPKNVAKFLKDYFADIPLMARIGACESHNRQYDSSGNVLRGEKNVYDRGVMQINLLYHADEAVKMGLDLNSIDGNVAFARHLYEKFGAQPWISSSACWSKFASQDDLASIAKK